MDILHNQHFNPEFVMTTMLKHVKDYKFDPYKEGLTNFVYDVSNVLTALRPVDFQTSTDAHILQTRAHFIHSMIPQMKDLLNNNKQSHYVGKIGKLEDFIAWTKCSPNVIIINIDFMIKDAKLEWSLNLRHVFLAACAFATTIYYTKYSNLFMSYKETSQVDQEQERFVQEVQAAKTWYSKALRNKMLNTFASFVKRG